MPMYYRRPGVYLEESLLVNPSDVAGTFTVAAFVGAAEKGPVNEPTLIQSWSDYVTLFGGLSPIKSPPSNPNDLTSEALGGQSYANLAALQADPNLGNGYYTTPAFTAGRFVVLNDGTKAHYPPPVVSTNRATAAPGQGFAADTEITASDDANAAKLALETPPFVAAPTSAWTTGQNIWIGPHAFYWNGTAWKPGTVQGTAEVQTITPTGTISGGTFTLTLLNNVTTGAIAYNATNAAIKTAIDTAFGGAANHKITVAGGPMNTASVTLTYGGYGDVIQAVVTPLLTGTDPALTVTTTTEGVNVNVKNNSGVWVADAMAGTGAAVPPTKGVLSFLPFSVYSFFQNGGRVAWIVRACPTAVPQRGVNASVPVNGALAGSNLTSFNIKARSPGVWGNTVKYALAKQSTVGTGATAEDVFALQVLVQNSEGNDEIVETFPSLSVKGEIAGTRKVDMVLNDPVSGSLYIMASGVNEDQPQPAETDSPVALAGGVDPTIPDAADLQNAANTIEKVDGPVALNIVGYLNDIAKIDDPDEYAGAWVGTTIPSTYFNDRSDIFVINDSAPPRNPGTESNVYKTQIQTALGANTGDSYSASYAPWLIIPNPSRVGTTINVPPGGAVLGMMARIDATVGVFRAPAGVIAGLSNAVGVQSKFTDTELGDLNSQNINVIRSVVGSGICVMGARTRKTYGADRYVSARRTLIYIKEVMKRSTQFAVFENNDQNLWSALRMSAERILRPLWEAGGLKGSNTTEAYYITCDDTINTPQVIQSGEVRMEVGVALQYPAEFVVIRITQFDRGTFAAEVIPAA